MERDDWICEGIVTTVDAAGRVNIAPMGPIVGSRDGVPDWSTLTLRPYDRSQTYANLDHTPRGVFHVTDDVGLFAEAAIGDSFAETVPVRDQWFRLADCCRWYAFEVVARHHDHPRETMQVEVRESGTVREFAGFHRARHAVLEAAILATRRHLLDPQLIAEELDRWRPLIAKTATSTERDAWTRLEHACRETAK